MKGIIKTKHASVTKVCFTRGYQVCLLNPVFHNEPAFDRLPEIIGTSRLTAQKLKA